MLHTFGTGELAPRALWGGENMSLWREGVFDDPTMWGAIEAAQVMTYTASPWQHG